MKNRLFIFGIAALTVSGVFLAVFITGHNYLGYICLMTAALAVLFRYAGKKLRIIMTVLVIIGIAVFAVFEYSVISMSRTDADGHCDYIIVMGAGLNGDVPSLSLTNRLSAALKYMEEYPECSAIVSGGQGPGENMTEAEAMSTWLQARGIAPERIIEERESTSTRENLEYSFEIIRRRGDDPDGNVSIVTSEYHLCRATLVARSMGVDVYRVAAETSLFSLKLNYFIREGFAMAYYKIFGGI